MPMMRVHGRANFVAHLGQEVALGPGGRLGRFLGLPQPFLDPPALTDVAVQPDRKVAVPHSARRGAVLDDVLFAVRTNPREDSRKRCPVLTDSQSLSSSAFSKLPWRVRVSLTASSSSLLRPAIWRYRARCTRARYVCPRPVCPHRC